MQELKLKLQREGSFCTYNIYSTSIFE